MALLGQIVTNDGINHEFAYARIVEANLNWAAEHGKIVINIYHDQASRDGGKLPIEQRNYSFFPQAISAELDENGVVVREGRPAFITLFSVENLSTEGSNIIQILYDHFKTYPEWAAWGDI